MKTTRTFNTLFMLMSVDGKISTGDIDARDVDADFPRIPGVREGLPQYYALERQTDIVSFNTGRVMAKIGMNTPKKDITPIPVTFVIVDRTHLTQRGVENLARRCARLFIVTTNRDHPAYRVTADNLTVLSFSRSVDFKKLFSLLRVEFDIRRVTIQSGGTLNSMLVRAGLIDRLSLVVAPAIVGGAATATLMDGPSLRTVRDLSHIAPLKLRAATKLKHSYLHLEYDVVSTGSNP